jgi:uncharacterized protein YktA (UPF0223 family)
MSILSQMKYVVYKKWHGSELEQVIEYFPTVESAAQYALTVTRSHLYEVHVGMFVDSLSME